jgi:hypothetical protein
MSYDSYSLLEIQAISIGKDEFQGPILVPLETLSWHDIDRSLLCLGQGDELD